MARKPLEGLRVSVARNMVGALEEAATKLFNSVQRNATLTDHSLDDLAKLGHPYNIRSSVSIHSPSYLVHQQSGRLSGALKLVRVNQYSFNIGIEESAVPYLLAVVYGTRYMVGRDFIRGSLLDLDDDLRNVFSKALSLGVQQGPINV